MKNPNIARVLKYYRNIRNLSVNEVSNILREQDNYAAPKTIYGWESGHTQPDADTLMFLCELYQIEDILGAFGYKENEDSPALHLSPKEMQIIQKYREHTHMQQAVDKLLEIEEEK